MSVRNKTLWETKPTIAYAWRSGLIGYGKFAPAGTLPIMAWGDEAQLKEAVDGLARRGYPPDNPTLVPGIPEASGDQQALEALLMFTGRVRKSLAQEMGIEE